MHQEKAVTIERLSVEFAFIFQILEEAYDLIYKEDRRRGVLISVIAPLNMILRDLSDLSDRVAQNRFAIREGRINCKFGGDLVSHVVQSIAYVLHESVEPVWANSPAKREDWECFDRATDLFDHAYRRLKVLVSVLRKDFEQQEA